MSDVDNSKQNDKTAGPRAKITLSLGGGIKKEDLVKKFTSESSQKTLTQSGTNIVRKNNDAIAVKQNFFDENGFSFDQIFENKHAAAVASGNFNPNPHNSIEKEENSKSQPQQTSVQNLKSKPKFDKVEQKTVGAKPEKRSVKKTTKKPGKVHEDENIDTHFIAASVASEEEDTESNTNLNVESAKRKIESVEKIVKYDKFSEFDYDDDISKIVEGQKLQEFLNKNTLGSEEENRDDIMLKEQQEDVIKRRKSKRNFAMAKVKTQKREQRMLEEQKISLPKDVEITETISVQDLAKNAGVKVAEVIKIGIKLGLMCTPSTKIDGDTAELIVVELGHNPVRVNIGSYEDLLKENSIDKDIRAIPPIVTVMGHVDHGKTSLLDALKKTDVVAGEAGGITQHIGAYKVHLENGKEIIFIDTPGHEAFSTIRSRGTKVTDIVVLVVAADDGIKPQTIEAINHAKKAKVPIIVAINKIDKPDANPLRIKQDLLQYELVSEDLGGDVMVVEISAKQHLNLDKLEEAILLQAEILDLKSNFNGSAFGTVLEAKLDIKRGIVANVLIQRGKLSLGQNILAGESVGRVRVMMDEKNQSLQEVFPVSPVEIYGFETIPKAGDKFYVVENDKVGRDIAEQRQKKRIDAPSTAPVKNIAELFAQSISNVIEINVIIKADNHSSSEAVKTSLERIQDEEVKVKVLQCGAGNITEADINFAKSYNAAVLGFGVKLDNKIIEIANRNKVQLRSYNIIYELINFVENLAHSSKKPKFKEVILGDFDIRQIFNITGHGKIAGGLVLKGIVKNKMNVRIFRGDAEFHVTKIRTLKRFKENVTEVNQGFECGIQFDNFEDFEVGDRCQIFDLKQEVK